MGKEWLNIVAAAADFVQIALVFRAVPRYRSSQTASNRGLL